MYQYQQRGVVPVNQQQYPTTATPSSSSCFMQCQCCPYKTSGGTIAIITSTIAFFVSFGALQTCHFLTIPIYQDIGDDVVDINARRSIGVLWSEPPPPSIYHPYYNDGSCIYYTDEKNDIELDSTFKFVRGIGILTSVLSSVMFLALTLGTCCIKCTHGSRSFFGIISISFLLFGCFTGLTFVVIHHSDVCDNECELDGGGYVMAIATPLWIIAAASVVFILCKNNNDDDDDTTFPQIRPSGTNAANADPATNIVTNSNFESLSQTAPPSLFYPKEQQHSAMQQPPHPANTAYYNPATLQSPLTTPPTAITPSHQEPRVSVPPTPTAPLEEDSTTEIPYAEALVVEEEEPTK